MVSAVESIHGKTKEKIYSDKIVYWSLEKTKTFSNCKQTSKGSCIKVISNKKFSPFYHVKFQLIMLILVS